VDATAPDGLVPDQPLTTPRHIPDTLRQPPRLKTGRDLTAAVHGLPNDLCQCLRRGHIPKGERTRHTGQSDEIDEAGQAFHCLATHNPVALNDCE
jgi:hypothetical protein